MAIMHLSVSSVPFSINGVAGIDLIVSVTRHDGKAYTGLTKPRFTVKWILDTIVEQTIKSWSVSEYKPTTLPEMPGVYLLHVQSASMHWSPTSSNISTFYIKVSNRSDHGQTLYTVEDPSIALP
jgi:hypothetical protein